MNVGYEVLTLVVGVIIANELMRFGFKQLIGRRYDRLNHLDEEIDEIKRDVKTIKQLLLRLAMDGKLTKEDVKDLI